MIPLLIQNLSQTVKTGSCFNSKVTFLSFGTKNGNDEVSSGSNSPNLLCAPRPVRTVHNPLGASYSGRQRRVRRSLTQVEEDHQPSLESTFLVARKRVEERTVRTSSMYRHLNFLSKIVDRKIPAPTLSILTSYNNTTKNPNRDNNTLRSIP